MIDRDELISYLYDIEYYIDISTIANNYSESVNTILGEILSILDGNPNLCYIFANENKKIYILSHDFIFNLNYYAYTPKGLIQDNRILYIYNPHKEKFQIFFKDNHIDYPDWVNFISRAAFYKYIDIDSITIPNSVKSIGNCAFFGCKSLTSIIIPNSVTSIGDYAFDYCEKLTSIVVEEGNSVYDSRDNCNAIIETSTNTLILGCQNTVIPNSVRTIGNNAFSGSSNLTSIAIPNSVKSIGVNAFYRCTNLTSITIPNSVKSIGPAVFEGCKKLTIYTSNPYVITYCKINKINYTK